MSSFVLKLIAIAAMLCDHIGAVFFPSALWLRAIGRLTMPIMAYFAAVGFRNTKNVHKYLLRLGIFAVLSEIPYYLLFGAHSNVIFTIFLGVLALYTGELAAKYLKNQWVKLAPYLICCVLAWAFQTDWSFTGVLLIIAFYYANGKHWKNLVYPLPVYAVYMLTFLTDGFHVFQFNLIQLYGLLSLPLLCFYNGKRGPRAKYLFYVFYPAHLLLIFVIALYINGYL